MNNEPGHEGLYIFTGHRRTASRGYIVTTNDICEVFCEQWGDTKRWYAVFMGRAHKHAIEQFEGTWRPVRVDFGGERCS
jgi:hypothetical protein